MASLAREVQVNPAVSTYLSVSGQRVPTKSKTDDLERYIAEIEASEAEAAGLNNSGSSGPGGIGIPAQTSTTVSRKYTRRRYTDNRHPTTELPDMTSASTGAINVTSTMSPERPLIRRRTQQLA